MLELDRYMLIAGRPGPKHISTNRGLDRRLFRALVVEISTDQLQYIINHARSVYPEECCGFLIGTKSNPRRVSRVLTAQNVAQPSRLKRYNIDPKELIRADEEARRSGLNLIGVYHSHPDAPVEPSQFDLEHAWPAYTYIVLSLQNGEPRDVAAWSLSQNGTAFQLDELRVR